ncbi:GspH/FimT family pseudopilin [Diaphorobacter nitroreducens]|uniref:GspH/FimT family pseudopilin n=1 Tax=Diaphorobacter nitroreducens TaxID=164759 RepID=UPI0028A048BC|nr:GspH/FimT family pseudopilin [Diaphorobacter nitroreducens]
MQLPHAPSRQHWPQTAERGFTVIELMVVVTIMAVLAALATPSFTPIIEGWRVRQAANGLESTLYYARSEAIKRGGNVVIQKLPSSTSCTAANVDDWNCGWQVLSCSSINASGTCADPEVLQSFETPAKLEVTRSSGGARIQLNRWGLVDGTWLGFSLVPLGKSLSNSAARGVCMSSGGRVRIIPPEDIPCTG